MDERKILHVDMNNFYASVECMLNPSLRGHAVAVCGDVEERHGIVLAKNYPAKACGVKTGEAIWQAQQKCPKLIVVPPHYDHYARFSKMARAIYGRYTDLIEPYGMDECWLDVTGSTRLLGSPLEMAHDIRKTITRELGLTVSVGVSFNKIFAKLGSDLKKPDAVTCIPSDSFREIVWPLPATDLLGVGYATGKSLASVGLHTIGQLANWPVEFFQKRLGICGVNLWRWANGQDHSPVITREWDVPDKSCGNGLTLPEDLKDNDAVWKLMLDLCQEIGHRLLLYRKKATGVQIMVRDTALLIRQWQIPLRPATQSSRVIAATAFKLFLDRWEWKSPIRTITVRATGLVPENQADQLDVFCDATALERAEQIDRVTDDIRNRFGTQAIRHAVLLNGINSSDGNHSVIMPTGLPRPS